jgi:hypothetical protein
VQELLTTLAQHQDGSIKLTLTCHPQDAAMAARLLADAMGKVYHVVLVDQEAI